MGKNKRAKIFDIVKQMPPLRHSISGQAFNIRSSEVMKWILQDDMIWNYIWDCIKQSGAIVYNSNTGKWQGINYHGD